MKHILKCQKCSEYTMKEKCSCSGNAVSPKPLKFSLEDTYAHYRRKAKLAELKKEGLL